jgi:LemA protein
MDYNISAYPWIRWIKWAAAGLALLIIIIIAVVTYNKLVDADQNVEKAWSQVENVMQARVDKITKLMAIVKEYDSHEEKVFSDIANAASVLLSNSGDINDKLKADEVLADALNKMLSLADGYPDLKASEQFTNLQVAVEGAENRVSVERKRFIESVQAYNIRIKKFPGSIFARLMGFTEKAYYKADVSTTST